MKELENLIYIKDKEINKLTEENDLVNKLIERQERVYEETMEERGFSEKIDNLNTEITNLKKQVKAEQKESLARINKQKSVNNATLLVETKYRELCERNNFIDYLKVNVQRSEDNAVTGVEISNDE